MRATGAASSVRLSGLPDGALAECDRAGDGRADHSHKHRHHGVNMQVATAQGGQLRWLSPALPGRTHDLTAARLRDICRRLGKPVLMDPEGDYGHPVLGFDVEADRVVLLAEPPLCDCLPQ